MADKELETGATAGHETIEATDFEALLNKEFRPKSDAAKSAVEEAVKTLAEQALSNTALISDDALRSIENIVAQIDKKLTEQVNLILHHQDFQQLESAWRGLHYLVNNTETDDQLKIRVMSISKKEMHKTLKKFKGTAWDQSPIFKKVYEEEFGQFGGEPYGSLVADYHFDHSPPDVELLGEMAKIAAAAHAPLITGANPTLFQMDSWSELANPRDLTKIFQTPEYASWRSLRESEDSKYVGMAMPRFLGRLPYGSKTAPVEAFAFEEDTDGSDATKYGWVNAAYGMAVNINRSFKEYGWCSRIRGIESGGAVENLPSHTFPTDDGGVDQKCPTCRFAHYLKCIVRDKVGSYKSRDDMQQFLQTWVNQYVDRNSETSPEDVKARQPLAAAEVVVEEVEGNPGYYSSKFFLRPHYQLEGLSVSLRLVSKLPTEKG